MLKVTYVSLVIVGWYIPKYDAFGAEQGARCSRGFNVGASHSLAVCDKLAIGDNDKRQL